MKFKDAIKLFKEGDHERTKLFHLRNRCKLESIPLDDIEEAGNAMMDKFLERIDENALRELFKSENNSNTDNAFFEFLNKEILERKEEEYNKQWEERAETFIKLLANYRPSLDARQQTDIIDHLKALNNDPLRYIYELIQNADDCDYNNKTPQVEIKLSDNRITISYNENGMTPSDIIAITSAHESNKIAKKKVKKIIGEKGIGFKTVFSVCSSVDIHSGQYHFSLPNNSFVPTWIDKPEGIEEGTTMILNIIADKTTENGEVLRFNADEMFWDILKKYGVTKKDDSSQVEIKKNSIFKNCPIMFTINISKISIKHKNYTLIISRDTTKDGEMTITYEWNDGVNTEKCVLDCLWVKKDVEFTDEEYRSHYSDVFKVDDKIDKEVKTYTISAVVPQNPVEDGITSGGVYTYLPTYMQTRAPISFQIPFELNTDRSAMWIKSGSESREGAFMEDSGRTTKWNKRLFDETFIGDLCLVEILFEKLRTVVSENRSRMCVADYAPRYGEIRTEGDSVSFNKDSNLYFFFNENGDDKCLRDMNEYCGQGEENCIYKLFCKTQMFTRLNNTGWVCAEGDHIMYDSFATDILKRNINSLDENEKEKLIAFFDIEKEYAYLSSFKIEKYSFIDDKQIIGFANRLIALDRQNAIENLALEKSSDYLPKKQLKDYRLIPQQNGEFATYNERKVWFAYESDNPSKTYSVEDPVGLWRLSSGDPEADTEKKLETNLRNIFSDNKCVIYNADYEFKSLSDKENTLWDKLPKYRFEVFVQAMSLLAQMEGFNGDWFEYTKSLIELVAADKDNKADNADKEKIALGEKIITLMQKPEYQKNIVGGVDNE